MPLSDRDPDSDRVGCSEKVRTLLAAAEELSGEHELNTALRRILTGAATIAEARDQYDAGVQLIGVDLSGKILARSARRARSGPMTSHLKGCSAAAALSMTFDMVTATYVFCSVADPLTGWPGWHGCCDPVARRCCSITCVRERRFSAGSSMHSRR